MYFQELEQSFLSLQKRLNPDYVIEVGAREASFSLGVKQLLPDSKVYAFEANPHVHAKFSMKCEQNGINYLNLGVSNFTGKTEFFINGNKERTDGSHSFLKRINVENNEKVTVDCSTLDDFFIPMLSPTDKVALWIDAEGLAGQILEGASKLLSQVSSIYIEVEHIRFWEDQILSEKITEILESRDYFLIGRDLEYFPVQENYLFINPWIAKFV
jgi:FkbM family methyltransferase